jgi:hypothetical protein
MKRLDDRNWLGALFMVPAAAILLLFLTYPLGLGVWLSLTDQKIGRPGEFIGLENFRLLWDDSVFWLSVFNTLFFTAVASVLKFVLGLWLALLLNRVRLPLGLADGRSALRLAAGRDPVLVLRGALRRRPHGRGQGVRRRAALDASLRPGPIGARSGRAGIPARASGAFRNPASVSADAAATPAAASGWRERRDQTVRK